MTTFPLEICSLLYPKHLQEAQLDAMNQVAQTRSVRGSKHLQAPQYHEKLVFRPTFQLLTLNFSDCREHQQFVLNHMSYQPPGDQA